MSFYEILTQFLNTTHEYSSLSSSFKNRFFFKQRYFGNDSTVLLLLVLLNINN